VRKERKEKKRKKTRVNEEFGGGWRDGEKGKQPLCMRASGSYGVIGQGTLHEGPAAATCVEEKYVHRRSEKPEVLHRSAGKDGARVRDDSGQKKTTQVRGGPQSGGKSSIKGGSQLGVETRAG